MHLENIFMQTLISSMIYSFALYIPIYLKQSSIFLFQTNYENKHENFLCFMTLVSSTVLTSRNSHQPGRQTQKILEQARQASGREQEAGIP